MQCLLGVWQIWCMHQSGSSRGMGWNKLEFAANEIDSHWETPAKERQKELGKIQCSPQNSSADTRVHKQNRSYKATNFIVICCAWEANRCSIHGPAAKRHSHTSASSLHRCASLFAYADEDKHIEMREHMTEELLSNSAYYISANNQLTIEMIETYTIWSQYFDQTSSTTQGMRDVYFKEVEQGQKNGNYLGIWHLISLANVLNRPVTLVYPQYSCPNIRPIYHRTFLPSHAVNGKNEGSPVHIMWTNTTGSQHPPVQWKPNDVVTLMPIDDPVDLNSNITAMTSQSGLNDTDEGFTLNDILSEVKVDINSIFDVVKYHSSVEEVIPGKTRCNAPGCYRSADNCWADSKW